MTREEAIAFFKDMKECTYGKLEAVDIAIKALEQEPRKDEVILTNKEYREQISNEYEHGYCKGYTDALKEQESVLDKIRAEIEQKIEQERFARSVFRGEEKDDVKAEQCTGSIFAYNNVIKIIDKYRAESEVKE